MTRLDKLIFFILLMSITVLLVHNLKTFGLIVVQINKAIDQQERMMDLYDDLIKNQHIIIYELNEQHKQIKELQEWKDNLFGMTARVTAYAPGDPGAIEGMCYEGDPNVTANGGRPVPGETVAAGPGVPFGALVWVEGVGVREVNDRGGRIGDRDLDLVMASRGEAFAWGVQERRALVLVAGGV